MHLSVVAGSKPSAIFCYIIPQIESFPIAFVRSMDQGPGDVVERNGNFILAVGIRNKNENLHLTLKF